MRRLIKRDLRSDEGLGLVETVVALLVFSLVMTGLAASMMTFAHQTGIAKARAVATSLAQHFVEKARAVGYANLQVCSGGGAPATAQFRGAGTAYPVVTGTNVGCLPYRQNNFARDGINFDVTQLVLAKPTVTDTAGKPQTELYLIVSLGWNVAGSARQSYELDTLVNNEGKLAAAPAQGIRFVVNDTTGNVIGNESSWNVTIKDASSTVVDSGETDEGYFSSLALPVGTYTCTIARSTASQGYTITGAANPGKTVDTNNGTATSSCTVSTTTVTDWTTAWAESATCASTLQTGTLTVTVNDATGHGVQGASVALTNANGNAGTPSAQTTDSSGVATFSGSTGPPGDSYTYVVSKSGYTTTATLGPVCVVSNTATAATATLVSAGCAYSSSKGTLIVTVKDLAGAPIKDAVVSLTKITSGAPAAPGDKTTLADGTATFQATVGGGSYNYQVTKPGSYAGSGLLGPICVVAGATTNASATLSPPGSGNCVRDTGTKGKLTVTVVDQNNSPVNGAHVTTYNVNGDSTEPNGNTNSSGVVTLTGMVDDPYQYTVTGPSGYSSTGALGPVCIVGTGTTSVSVTLTATMTVVVKVTNNDILATKNYNVILTDPSGNVSSQSLTIARTKNLSATFAGLPTANRYTVSVCAVQPSGNCDAIATTTNDFPNANTTYNVSVTDAKGGS